MIGPRIIPVSVFEWLDCAFNVPLECRNRASRYAIGTQPVALHAQLPSSLPKASSIEPPAGQQRNVSDAHMHSQQESRLLSAPAEIRRAIYANVIPDQVHVFLSHGRLQLSVCLQPNLGDDSHDGYERGTTHDWSTDATWAGRLRSSWGPHWECEEVAKNPTDLRGSRRHDVLGLLFSCKRMFLDVTYFMTEITAFNVTDPETLDVLLRRSDKPSNNSNRLWNLWDCTRLNIRKLNLTFRLPLSFYEALEDEGVRNKRSSLLFSSSIEWLDYGAWARAFLNLTEATNISAASRLMNVASTPFTKWLYFWPAVYRLQQLRSLCIWLDHDDPSSWSSVKERLALRHITNSVAAREQVRRQKDLPHIDILLNLPKLHPETAKPDTHFIQDSLPPPFTIERRIRQRYHCEETAGGNLAVRYKADFPFTHELPELFGYPTMTLEGIEEMERGMWEDGFDVESFMRDERGGVFF
ncbi:hypothetical protein F5Y10DRAFT_150740 [Nemania abortiva]|nr:hypothetical protein F5Y10DRAFT_150740 [Nemania abortiva]